MTLQQTIELYKRASFRYRVYYPMSGNINLYQFFDDLYLTNNITKQERIILAVNFGLYLRPENMANYYIQEITDHAPGIEYLENKITELEQELNAQRYEPL